MAARNPRNLVVIWLCPALIIMWLLYMLTPDGERISFHFGSDAGSLEAFYKRAYYNQDGSLDMVFNIPDGGNELLMANSQLRQKLIIREKTSRQLRFKNGSSVGAGGEALKHQIKTNYPISLDADYVINPVHACPVGKQVDYIVIVHSATTHFARRRIIRETYGAKWIFGHITQRVVFLLGTNPDADISRRIREEAVLFKDVVQGSFYDSYHNLTHKGVMGYRWISEHCPQAKLVIKVDDDVFMNPFRIVQYILPEYSNKSRHIVCHVRPPKTSPIYRDKSKWQVNTMEFKGMKHYPFYYCNGYFVIITSDLIRPMLNAARINPFFWIDDVYLFGLLPETVGSVKFVNIRNDLTLSFEKMRKCLVKFGAECSYFAVGQWVENKPDHLWYMALSNLTQTHRNELHLFKNS